MRTLLWMHKNNTNATAVRLRATLAAHQVDTVLDWTPFIAWDGEAVVEGTNHQLGRPLTQS